MLKNYIKPIAITLLTIIAIKGLLYLKGPHAPQLFGTAIHRVDTPEKVVALTYDDGPKPGYTEQILYALEEYNVPATFFVVGQELDKYPEYLEKIISRGHDIGNHSWSHAQMLFKSPATIREEIDKTDALIKQLGYTKEIHFRAPYGRKLIILPWVLSQRGRKHILFDVEPHDWANPGVDVIVERVVSKVKPGSIVALHDGGGHDRTETVDATRKIIEQLRAQGYRFVTVSELLALQK